MQPKFAKNLEYEQMRTLSLASIQASVGHIILITVMAASASFYHGLDAILLYIAFSLIVFSSIRYVQGKRYVANVIGLDIKKTKMLFDLIIFLSSLSWTFFIARVFYLDELLGGNLVIMYFMLPGLIGAAAYSLAYSKRSFFLFLLPMLAFTFMNGFRLAKNPGDLVSQQIVYVMFMVFVVKNQRDQFNLWLENFKQKEELKLILESFPVGISVIEDGKYAYINDIVARQAGVTVSQIAGKSVGFTAKESEYSELIVPFLASNENRYVGEINLFDKQDCIKKAHIIILQKLTSNNRMICVTLDINEKKKIEAALAEQTSKAMTAAKMASLGEMAAGLAHEMNNPLAIISTLAYSLKNEIKMDPFDKEKVTVGLTRIELTVTRIANIIKGLRTFARNAEGDPFIEANVSEVIKDTLGFCRGRFEGLKVELKFEGDETLTCQCRPTQISQVVLNLLNNALDAVDDLKTKWVRVNLTGDDDYVYISVTDSGSGIPSQVQAKIMQPFFTTKEVGKGTGLGLSISHGIARTHKGSLEVDNECENTRFVLTLPRRQFQSSSSRRAA